MKKKILFISLTLFLLIGIVSLCLLSNFGGNFLKEKNIIDQKTKNSLNNNVNNSSNDNEQKESTIIEDDNKIKNEVKEENTSTTSSNETKKEESVAKQEELSYEKPVTKNNNSKTEQKPVVQEKQPDSTPTAPSTPPKETTPVVEAPKCTPKKFDMSYVRADFNTKAECDTKGELYKSAGYGYFCDHYQDDCLTTYYMLTIYERNTGIEYDFHTIPLP